MKENIIIVLAIIFIIGMVSIAVSDTNDPNTPLAEINNFSVGYLTEAGYNNGNFDDSAITTDTVFTSGTHQYMVIDLKIKALADNDGSKSVKIITRSSDTAVLSTMVQEAPTGKVESVKNDDGTSTYDLLYTIPAKQDEEKSVRMIIKLVPHTEGDIDFNIIVSGSDNTVITGETQKNITIHIGSPS